MNTINNFIITTDSSCDLDNAYLNNNNIGLISLSFTLEGKTYVGDEVSKFDRKEFYNKLRNGSMPITSQINPADAESFFEQYLKQGMNVLHIAFSSGLSGSYNSAVIAAEELKDKYEAKVIVIDSLCASLGQGLFIHYAVEMKKQGKSIDEIAKWLEENKLKVCHMFTVDDLNHLHRGGRVSKTVAFLGTMIGIKPVMHMDNNGKLTVLSKARGRKQSLISLVDYMKKSIGNNENKTVFISHGDSEEDAKIVADLVQKQFGIDDIYINYVGPVIGAHSGPGTIALFFIADYR